MKSTHTTLAILTKDEKFQALVSDLKVLVTRGFNRTLVNFNQRYPVGMSGYFRTLSDYFYAKGYCACLLDNI